MGLLSIVNQGVNKAFSAVDDLLVEVTHFYGGTASYDEVSGESVVTGRQSQVLRVLPSSDKRAYPAESAPSNQRIYIADRATLNPVPEQGDTLLADGVERRISRVESLDPTPLIRFTVDEP